MKLRMKLMVAPLITAAMLLGSVGITVWLIESFRQASGASHTAVLAAQGEVYGLQDRLALVHTRLYRTVAIIGSLDDKSVSATRAKLAAELAQIAADARKGGSGAATDPAMQASLTALAQVLLTYQKAADNAIDLATVDLNTGVAALQTADTHFKGLTAQLSALISRVKARAEEEDAALIHAAHYQQALAGAFGVLAAALSLAFAWTIQRRIARELVAASQAAVQVAGGRLDMELRSDSTDELGELTRALGTMVAHLRKSMETVQIAAESITTAGAEIASGNLDLSNRTEQTAGSLQQTAASMEQLTVTVRQSEHSHQQAHDLAASAANIALRGGQVVGDVVATMQDIHESATRISDIIAVIDGIAFQTNILALNAAVEAARAGEQGRGFAVVASEVRNLAQRSAQAAKEIKTLIGTSVDKVECGSRLVRDAGNTMGEIVAAVQRVSHIIGEISVSATEQSKGIGQVNVAVTHLDSMTQQNAALVEQSAASAQSLSDQAQRLRDVVNEFSLGKLLSPRGALVPA